MFLLRQGAIGLLIITASICFVLGLILPVMKLTYFYFWSDTHSIVSIIHALYIGGEMLLAATVAVFSILFPAAKLIYLMAAFVLVHLGAGKPARLLAPMSRLGKWSMLDVLVLALTVFYVKIGGIADASTLPGIYFFTASVVMTMIAYAMIRGQQTRPDPA